jgi:O-antigen/teichoic acid export membrane protein
MVSRDAAGIYSVSYNAAYMISIVSSAINATYNPWLMQKVKTKDYKNVDGIGTTVTGGLLLIIFAFIFCAPEFVKIIASKDYYEAIYIIPAVAGSTFFSVIYTLYCPIAQYYLKVKQLSFITVVASILNVGLNYFAIERWGYVAAGYTTYICYFVYGWGTGIYCLKILNDNKMEQKIYDIRKLISLTVGLSVAVVIAPFFYNGYIIRYILLTSVCIIFAIYGKKYKSTIMKIREN